MKFIQTAVIWAVFGSSFFSAALFAAPPAGYALIWSDEFNDNSLNTKNWEYARNGWRNSAYDTSAAVSVANGYLVITTYTSGGTNFTGFIDTDNKVMNGYGYYEASIQYSNAPGQWSAFWLQSPYMMNVQSNGNLGNTNNSRTNGVEIDVFEHRCVDGNGSSWVNGGDNALHWNGYGPEEESAEWSSQNLGVSSGFHTYGLLWTTNGYTFYLDGNVTWTTTKYLVSSALQFTRLTSEVQSNSWAGTVPGGGYPSQANSQVKMLVDYVRYYAPAPANARLWTGASSAYWTNSANWVSNLPPVAGGDLMFTYQCTANFSMTMGQNYNMNGLVFLTSNGAFSINGTNMLTLGAGGIDMISANNDVILNAPINIGADQAWAIGCNSPGNTLTVNGGLSGAGTLTKASYGALILNGANRFSGTLNVDTGSSSNNDGVVIIANADALTNAAAIAIRNTGLGISTLYLSNSVTFPNRISLAGRNTNVVAIESFIGNNVIGGGFTLTGGGTNYLLQTDLGTLTIGGTIAADGTATGARTLTLRGNGTFSIAAAIQNGSASPLNLMKTNAGTLTLSGTNTFTGATTNWRGNLLLPGSLAGSLTVHSGTFAGTGAVEGDAVMQSGSELSPGSAIANAIGTLTFGGNLTLMPGSLTLMELNPDLATNDQLEVTGALNCGGTLYVANMGGTFAPGQSFRLFNAGSYAGNFSTLTLPPLSDGLTWDTNGLSNGILTVVGPPEALVFTNLNDGQLQLDWSYGALQTATNVSGPYSDLTGAASPFTIPTTNARQFFRVKQN
jgi:autotransporter-associated beta strand protein